MSNNNQQSSFTEQFAICSSHRRTIAWLLDFSIIFFLVRFAVLPFYYPQNWNALSFPQILADIYGVFLVIMGLILVKDCYKTQSFGRWFFFIKIAYVQENLPLASFRKCCIRNLFLLLGPIELGFFLFAKLHRRLGDKYLGTVVICDRAKLQIRQVSVRLLAVLLVISILWSISYLTAPIFVNKSTYYQIAVASIAQNSQLQKINNKDSRIGYFKELYSADQKIYLVGTLYNKDNNYKITWTFYKPADQQDYIIENISINEKL